jgi:arginine deiminase
MSLRCKKVRYRRKVGFVAVAMVLLLFLSAIATVAQTATLQVKVGSKAEWSAPKAILMHTPGDEIFLGVVHPAAALFEKPFSIKGAIAEHRKYIELLREQGATVYTVVETLLEGTVDSQGDAMPGPKLDALRNFAKEFLTIDASALPEKMKIDQPGYEEETLKGLHPKELVEIILKQPILHLFETESNTGLGATYELRPLMNLYFLRDQMITTAKGIVISKMNSEQRAPETKIIKFVLSKLGIEPLYEVTGDGRLEGGDYFSAGDTALIGQGLRTNAIAIRQLLDNQVFGLPRVAVVKDSWKNQEEMHLDTYFNIISPGLAVLVKLRMNTLDELPTDSIQSKVDVYELENDDYKLKATDIEFQRFLEEEMGFKVIPVSRDDQLRYGINFLTIGPNRILAIDGVNVEYKKALKDAGVEATWMDFHNLTGGYGAAHCTTQVLLREDTTTENK